MPENLKKTVWREKGEGLSAEHGVDAGEGGGEAVDFLAGVVHGEGRADRTLDAVAFHQRLGAVVARAHGDAELVEEYACVVVVGAGQEEGYDRGLVGRGAVDV